MKLDLRKQYSNEPITYNVDEVVIRIILIFICGATFVVEAHTFEADVDVLRVRSEYTLKETHR